MPELILIRRALLFIDFPLVQPTKMSFFHRQISFRFCGNLKTKKECLLNFLLHIIE